MSSKYFYSVSLVFFPPLRTIFDWKTPTAYIFAFAFQCLVTAYAVVIGAVLLIHMFTTIWLFVAFIDDIKTDMRALDAYEKTKISEQHFYEHLCDLIKFHTEIKQLSCYIHCALISTNYPMVALTFIFRVFAQFGKAYGLLFILNLLWTASAMVVVLVSLQMELVEYNLV